MLFSGIILFVCENGFISVNPPLTNTRLGSLSTRTAHPVFLKLFQRLLDAADLRVHIENPYRFKTKGEMLKECSDQEFLKKNAHITTSCGRFGRMYKSFEFFLNPKSKAEVKVPLTIMQRIPTWSEDRSTKEEVVWKRTQPMGALDGHSAALDGRK